MVIPRRLTTRRLWPLAVAAGLALPSAGRAFYFDYGPGSGAAPAPSLVPPPALAPASSMVAVHDVTDTTNGPTDTNPKPPPPDGPHAPEPATGLAGLIGLAVIGAAKLRRRK